ncbi:multidrug effflux MFS transporter [Roseomonas sp. 18066]|uniref:multidrug effflux MFS transporter n=1 Tax=Roseomonas sp. 18066 TaxID=2681412 RepID=UPI001F46E173|nr:multidrug effflux MFS transporter [Roseomonas sp. 18066]
MREQAARGAMGFRQFVALIAALMAVNALAIDSMLPALPEIGRALGIATDNDRQWIITAYLLGFGAAQIVYGPLADRFGRKPVLLTGLVIYTLCSIACALAPTLDTMLLARAAQGVGAAGARVLTISIVRDRYAGPQMARVMSLSFIVFLAVPIIAPSIGQAIVSVAPWPWIFGVLATFGALVSAWVTFRLPETLNPADRMPINPGRVARAFAAVLGHRSAVGYMLAMTMMLGCIFGFINSVQQLFADVFHAEALFPAVFALIAGFMALASLTNARVVVRFGSRRISHLALLGYIVVGTVHALVALAGYETLWSFILLQAPLMFCFGLAVPNFGALAMEPLGHVAGTASAVQGFVTTLGGALIGFWIGQHFDGTAVPMLLGLAACGIAALGCVLYAERGTLFSR